LVNDYNLNMDSNIRDIELKSYRPIETNVHPQGTTNVWPGGLISRIAKFCSVAKEWVSNHKGCVLIIASIMVGTVFYKVTNHWRISTSVFYAVNTLLGMLFMVPANTTDFADVFTVLYYIYGAFFLAGMIGIYVGVLVSRAPEIAAEERRKLMEYPDTPVDIDGDGYVGFWDYWYFWSERLAHAIHWEDHKTKYKIFAAVVVWMLVGTVYCIFVEGKSAGSALFFALSTIAGACFVGPDCEGGTDSTCDIGIMREIALLIYVIIGYPLFTVLLGQFASLMVERTVREHEMSVLSTPLTEKEYNYAANLYGDDELISLGEFTILELLRLQRITLDDLNNIKMLFSQIDTGSTGNIDKPMLARQRMLRGYGSFDEVDLTRQEKNATPITPGDELFHYLTENDRANSMPPEITEEMYDAVVDTSLFEDEIEETLSAHPKVSSVMSSVRSSVGTLLSMEKHSLVQDEMGTSESSGRLGIHRMTIRKYNELVIPLAVSAVVDAEPWDTGDDGDY